MISTSSLCPHCHLYKSKVLKCKHAVCNPPCAFQTRPSRSDPNLFVLCSCIFLWGCFLILKPSLPTPLSPLGNHTWEPFPSSPALFRTQLQCDFQELRKVSLALSFHSSPSYLVISPCCILGQPHRLTDLDLQVVGQCWKVTPVQSSQRNKANNQGWFQNP